MFVGRKNELEFLQEKYESKKAELITIYGRRRIGKTELLREFVKDKKHIFYSGHEINNNMQLKRISRSVIDHFRVNIYSKSFEGWESMFTYIGENLSGKEKTIIVFDEFPYMVASNNSIPSVMQFAWDHILSKKNIMIIICGSSMSFMKKEVLSEKNPLYGRMTGLLKMTEMDFESSKAFYSRSPVDEQIAYYSVFSGVPYYLSLIDNSLSFKENIIRNILRNGSILFNEVEFLLKQELREVGVYNTIITAVALGRTKQNEIVQLTGIEKTKLSYYLNSLMDLGIVRKEFPSTVKTKDMPKSRNGLYQLDNGFFRFYYRFVYPYLSELSDGNIEIIYEDVIEKQLSSFIGYEFERIAINHMRQMNIENSLPIRCIKIGRWWKKDRKIDIVAYDSQNRYIFGECKWRNEKVGTKVLRELQEKSMDIKKSIGRYYILYSKSGFTEELINMSKVDKGIILVCM
ncbi:MAG TPA: ATP-binding protein [Clostridia bacterium]|nr:ATP-binding protein [Clostridia bacterium]